MAFPQVQTTNSGNSGANATSHTVTLPTGLTSGDLIIVAFAHDDAGAAVTASVTSPASGWSTLVNNRVANDAGTTARVSVFYRWADGSEGASITVTTTGSEGSAYATYRISGADTGTNPEATTNAPSSSNSPDPPNLAPSWGSDDNLFIVAYGWDGNQSHSSYPANYGSNQLTNRWANNNGAGIAMATRNLAAASDNPGTAGISGSEQWAAITIAVKPGAATSTLSGHAQALAQIKQTYRSHAQSQSRIKQTYSAVSQSQARIKQVYNVHGQANALVKQTYYAHAQSLAWIEATYSQVAQAQANVKNSYRGHGQALAQIKQVYRVHAQANASIAKTSFASGQAQATIKGIGLGVGQALASIRSVYNGSGQAQTRILATYTTHAQSQAQIRNTLFAFGQAQALIKQAYTNVAQAQALIKTTGFAHGQAQATILLKRNAVAQARAFIEKVFIGDIRVRVRDYAGLHLGLGDDGLVLSLDDYALIVTLEDIEEVNE